MSWGVKKLGDVAPARPLKPKSLMPDEEVWHLNLDAVESNSGKVTQKIMAPISEAGSSTHWFSEEHVLYSKLRPYLNKVVMPDCRGLATTELVPLLPKPNMLDRGYLAHYLRSERFLSWVNQQVAGAKMPRVSMKAFWEHEIPLPFVDEPAKSLAEQKRIAAILDKANSIRNKRQQAIELADKFLHDTFLTMFGDPVTNPKKWNQKRLGELGKISTGATPPAKEDECFDGPVPFVTPGDLGGIINGTNRTLSLKGALHSRICGPNSLLACCIGATIGKVGLSKIESAFNQQINAVDWNDEINSIYGYFMFKVCPKLITDKAIKTTLPILKKSLFQDIQVICPPLDIQIKFEKIYERVKSYYSLINNDRENSLFNALSQKAFKGEL